MSDQRELFASDDEPGDDPAYAALPPEIQEAFEAVSQGAGGARGAADVFFESTGTNRPKDPERRVPNTERGTLQQRYLDSLGEKRTRVTVSEMTVRVLDLCQDADAREYERIMTEIYPQYVAKPEDWQFIKRDLPAMIDPNPANPRGFRMPVVIEYCKIQTRTGHDPVEFAVVGQDSRDQRTAA